MLTVFPPSHGYILCVCVCVYVTHACVRACMRAREITAILQDENHIVIPKPHLLVSAVVSEWKLNRCSGLTGGGTKMLCFFLGTATDIYEHRRRH